MQPLCSKIDGLRDVCRPVNLSVEDVQKPFEHEELAVRRGLFGILSVISYSDVLRLEAFFLPTITPSCTGFVLDAGAM
jgi:hypothetical protein